jgi:hypothetical protein
MTRMLARLAALSLAVLAFLAEVPPVAHAEDEAGHPRDHATLTGTGGR